MNWVVLRIKSSGIPYTEDLDNIYVKCPKCDPHGSRDYHLGIHKKLPKYNCFRCGFKGRSQESIQWLETIIFRDSIAARKRIISSKEAAAEKPTFLQYELYKDTQFTKGTINRLMKFFVEKKFRSEYFEGLLSIYKKLFESEQAALTPLKDVPDVYRDRLVFFSKERTWASGRALSDGVIPKFKTEVVASAKELEWTLERRGTYFPQEKDYETLVVTEGPLDAFSLYALSSEKEGYRFFSPGGVNSFRRAIDSAPREKKVVVLTDRDQEIDFFKGLAKCTKRDYYVSVDFFKWPASVGKDPQDLFKLALKEAEARLDTLLDASNWIYMSPLESRVKTSVVQSFFQAMRRGEKSEIKMGKE